MPRCPDLVIFVLTDDDDRQTQSLILPRVHARRVIIVCTNLKAGAEWECSTIL